MEAEFVPKKDFWYAWSVRNGRAVLRICDYLQGAPDDVLADFGRSVIERGLGSGWRPPESFVRFVDSDEFILSRRPVFIRRSRNLARTDRGEHAFLPDSVDRLIDAGLLDASDVDCSWFSWTRRDSVRRVGFCATMFRVVGISSALDSPDVPQEALDYVVYHECLHLRQRYRPVGAVHDAEFRRWEGAYPGRDGCERILRGLGGTDRRAHRISTEPAMGVHGEARVPVPRD